MKALKNLNNLRQIITIRVDRKDLVIVTPGGL